MAILLISSAMDASLPSDGNRDARSLVSSLPWRDLPGWSVDETVGESSWVQSRRTVSAE